MKHFSSCIASENCFIDAMASESEIDLDLLSSMVRARRSKLGLGLRGAATQIGEISAPTLSRIEQGSVPDLDSFIRICRWLGVTPESLCKATAANASEAAQLHPAEKIEVLLRADRTLPKETADALGKMIRLAYDHASKGGLKE